MGKAAKLLRSSMAVLVSFVPLPVSAAARHTSSESCEAKLRGETTQRAQGLAWHIVAQPIRKR